MAIVSGGGGGSASSPLTLTSTAVGQIPLTVKAAVGQTGDLQEWKDETGAIGGLIDFEGGAFFVDLTSQRNVAAQARRWQLSSTGAVFTNADIGTSPILRVRQNNVDVLVLGGDSAGSALTIAPPSTSAIGFQIFPRVGHSVNVMEIYDEPGDIALGVSALGVVTVLGLTTTVGVKTQVITSGALPTVAPVSATAFQCSTARDVSLLVPVTYNPGVATTATCKVELSPDNVTFSTLITITKPVGTVFDGSIEPVTLSVPAAWYVKLTVVNATLGTGTYY